MRTPPNEIGLGELVERLPHIMHLQTDPTVWSSRTLGEAWKNMHSVLRETRSTDPARAVELMEKDLKGLAWCTSDAEIVYLLSIFHPALRDALQRNESFSTATVEEFFMHIGQEIEVRGTGWLVTLPPPSLDHFQFTLRMVGKFGEDGRGCVSSTSHRVSVWRGRHGEPLGVTVRVGRYVPNAAKALVPLTRRGSLLIISRAGLGKTTLLRDLATSIANNASSPRVAVVDTSNEIGGDDPVPMSFLGRCRRIQVPRREEQCRVMAEVIQNHSPEYLIVDELVSETEAQAAWSISQRGVRLIATCHGETLDGLLQNQALKILVGGTAQAFLSNEERRLRNKEKKTVLERPYSSPFHSVVEIIERNKAFLYVDVNKAVDLILDDKEPKKDASVGDFIDLLEPLPPRLMKLLNRKEDASQAIRNHFREPINEQGVVASPEKPRHRHDKAHLKQNKNQIRGHVKSSDKDLYKELSGFL